LPDWLVKVAVGLRLVAKIVSRHTCVCGSQVNPDGHHGFSCRRSVGRQSRHHLVNEILARLLRSIDVPTVLEAAGLMRGNGKRPDGMTLVP